MPKTGPGPLMKDGKPVIAPSGEPIVGGTDDEDCDCCDEPCVTSCDVSIEVTDNGDCNYTLRGLAENCDPSVVIDEWNWTLPGGGTATGLEVDVTIPNDGELYSVKLEVVDSEGCTGEATTLLRCSDVSAFACGDGLCDDAPGTISVRIPGLVPDNPSDCVCEWLTSSRPLDRGPLHACCWFTRLELLEDACTTTDPFGNQQSNYRCVFSVCIEILRDALGQPIGKQIDLTVDFHDRFFGGKNCTQSNTIVILATFSGQFPDASQCQGEYELDFSNGSGNCGDLTNIKAIVTI